MLEFLDDFFNEIKQHDAYSRVFVIVATTVGSVCLALTGIKIIYYAYSGFTMYVRDQLFHYDLKKKYGQWAVITGATDGIGLGFAKDLAARGHSLIILGRNEEKLTRVKNELSQISKSTDEIVTIRLDLANASIEDYKRVEKELKLDSRDVGILINNAGVFPDSIKRYLQNDIQEIKDSVGVNVISHIMMIKLVMPSMIQRKKGLIMNISSMFGIVSAPYWGVYGPAKHFITDFSRTLQFEYSSYPIDIINYSTGPVLTKLMTGWTNQFKNPSIITPHPDTYAKSALALVRSNYRETSGYWTHGIGTVGCTILDKLGVWFVGVSLQMRFSAKNNLLKASSDSN